MPHDTVHRVHSLPVTPRTTFTDDDRMKTIAHLFRECVSREGHLTVQEAKHGVELAEDILEERHTEQLRQGGHNND